jgi:hypothetical protein
MKNSVSIANNRGIHICPISGAEERLIIRHCVTADKSFAYSSTHVDCLFLDMPHPTVQLSIQMPDLGVIAE